MADPRDVVIGIRVSREEERLLRKEADGGSLSLSSYIRASAVRAAREARLRRKQENQQGPKAA